MSAAELIRNPAVMSYNWQQQQAGQQQQQQPQQQQQQQQGFPMGQQQTFTQPFLGQQQQLKSSEIGQNPSTSGIPGSMNSVQHPSFNSFSTQDQTNDVDLSNLLSNYQPKMISTQIQQQHPLLTQQMQDQSQSIDQASAAAAVAAYGHLGLQQAGSDVANMGMYGNPNATSMSMHQAGMLQNVQNQGPMGNLPRSMSGPVWTQMGQIQQQGQPQQFGQDHLQQQQQGFPPSANVLQNRFINPIRGNGGIGGGYEGDASATSSTQTPGASSGDDSNNAGKRRSNTVSYAHAPDLAISKGSTRTGFVSSSSGSPDVLTNNNVPSGVRHNVAPETSSLQAPQRPSLRHRRSHSGSQVVSSNNVSWNGETHGTMGKRLSGPSPSFAAAINQGATPYAQSLQTGHAASHPPGLGGQVLRGVDIGAGGSNAATDFTKRKGWHNRIVDELLDFVHVLDKDGRVIYAASSVGTLTGWKLEELRGRLITDFIHKDDAEAFSQEFQTCFEERKEMTMYYRFRKKPQTAEDKKRVRDQRIASTVGLSSSGSASEGDSSSNQDSSQRKIVSTFADGTTEARAEGNDDEESELFDDSEAKYVVFEVTGHPYFSSEKGNELENEKEEQKLADGEDPLEPTSPMTRPHLSTAQPSPQSKKKANRTSGTNATVKLENDTSVKQENEDSSNNNKKVQCFFLTGRVYPTKNVGMLDSFLELKLENERLRLLVGELSINDGSTALQAEGSSEGRRSLDEGAYPIDYPQDLESNRTGSTGHGIGHLGNGSLEDIHVANRNNSINSVHSNPSAPTSPQQIHLERSMTSNTIGGSTNTGEESDEAESPSLDGPDDPKRKKKKPKQEEGDYVCTDCGRVDSPEWRKGPLGPKTLCNACGLRWAKKIKRSGGDPNAVSKAGAAAKAQSAAKILGQTPMSNIPMNLAGPSHSFTGAANSMERPHLNSTQSSGAAMYGQIHQQHPQQPPLPRSATSFDTSMSSMQAAMYSASPTQMGFGSIPIQVGGGGGGGGHMEQQGQQQNPIAMPPLMHHNSSFMSQSPHIAPQMNNQISQHQMMSQQSQQQFQQQQQQQQIPFGQMQQGMPPNHSMF